jgi:CDP-glycerol glycerophosphotransferase (TagB/SpsB family)
MSGRGKRGLSGFILLILLSPIYLLVKLIPKDKRLYIYGSSLGLHFADNSKYLFLYASEKIGDLKSIFISRNKSLVEFLRENGYSAEYLYSVSGLITVLRAGKAFINHSAKDIHPLLMDGAEIIQLWHGTPLKKIGYDADWKGGSIKANIKNFIRRMVYFVFPFMYSSRVFDKIAVSSEEVLATYQTAFGIGRNKIEIIGQPRNDCLNPKFVLNKKIFEEIEFLESLKIRFSQIVAWLPTHRGLSGKTIVDLLNDYGFNNREFNRFLKENNIAFIVKPHFLERDALKAKDYHSDNFIVYDYVDPYPLLRYTDILITDYSSVFFDFLLTGRPLIFAPFDLEEYRRRDADFYYDYDDVTPGPKCRSWDEIIKEIYEFISIKKLNRTDPYTKKGLEMNDRFNYYKSGFCQRAADRFFDLDG